MEMDKLYQCNANVTHGRGYVYSLQYHLVWCTKYRKKILADAIAEDVEKHLVRSAKDLEIQILAMKSCQIIFMCL